MVIDSVVADHRAVLPPPPHAGGGNPLTRATIVHERELKTPSHKNDSLGKTQWVICPKWHPGPL